MEMERFARSRFPACLRGEGGGGGWNGVGSRAAAAFCTFLCNKTKGKEKNTRGVTFPPSILPRRQFRRHLAFLAVGRLQGKNLQAWKAQALEQLGQRRFHRDSFMSAAGSRGGRGENGSLGANGMDSRVGSTQGRSGEGLQHLLVYAL